MINGYDVRVGDRVYVMNRGDGTVTFVGADQSFDVSLGSSTLHFSTGGYIGQRRHVYWKNPVIIDPPKNAVWWTAFVNMIKAAYAVFVKAE